MQIHSLVVVVVVVVTVVPGGCWGRWAGSWLAFESAVDTLLLE